MLILQRGYEFILWRTALEFFKVPNNRKSSMSIFETDPNKTYSVQEFAYLRRSLAAEAETMANVINVFRNILPAINDRFNSIKSMFHNVKNDIMKANFKSIHGFLFSRDYNKKLKDAKFFQLAEMPIQVPEAFEGNLLEYGELLNSLAENYYKRVPEYLAEYRVYISAFISDKATKLSLKDYTSFYQTAEKGLDVSKGQVGKFVNKKYQTKSVAYFGKVVSNLSEVQGMSNSISRTESLCSIDYITRIDTEVKKTADLMTILINQIKDGSIADVSGASAKNISEGASVMAEMVEFCAMLRFRQEGYVNCVNQMLKELDKQIG